MNWDELIEQRNWKRIKSLLLADHSREQTHKSVGYILALMERNDVEAVGSLLNIVEHWRLLPYSSLECKNYVVGSIRRPHEDTKIAMIETVIKNSSAARTWCEKNTEMFLQHLMNLSSPQIFDHYYGQFDLDSRQHHNLLTSAIHSKKIDVFKILFSDDAKDLNGGLLARACREEFVELVDYLIPYSNIQKAYEILWSGHSRENSLKSINCLNASVSARQQHKLQQVLGHVGGSSAQKKM